MRDYKIVAVGGGTGLFTSLQALKQLQEPLKQHGKQLRLSAIVSMADDGGSTGRLRDDFGQLPPGDLRRALLALSHDTGSLRKLFTYRFKKGEGLSGHSMGNLLLTALTDIYGDEYAAIKQAGRILRVRGRVIPVTKGDTRLHAELEDGTIVKGETNIDIPKHDGTLKITRVWLDPEPQLFAAAKEAIEEADAIFIGPGDLYTSILPNLLVEGFPEAIAAARAKGAKIIYNTNTMTKHGETNGFKASDFVKVVEAEIGPIIALCNTLKPSEKLLAPYQEENAEFVECDLQQSPHVLAGELISQSKFVRHDADRLAKAYTHLVIEEPTYIFDLDDTLIRSSEVLFENAAKNVKKYLQEKGWDAARVEKLMKRRQRVGMGFALKEAGATDEEMNKIMCVYHDYELGEKFSYDDIDALKELKGRLFLITKGLIAVQEKKAILHEFDTIFEKMIFVDPTKGMNKHDEMKKLIEEEMIPVDRCFVVGDNPHDEIEAAKALGAKPILIDRGTRELGETGSITIIKNLHELSTGGVTSVWDSRNNRK